MGMTSVSLKPAILPRADFSAVLVLCIIESDGFCDDELLKACCIRISVLFNSMLMITHLSDKITLGLFITIYLY